MSVAAVRTPAAFEERLAGYAFERSEEARAVRVGLKETSEGAAIVARYADLFTRGQLEALREAEEAAAGEERERLFRLRHSCEGGLAATELAERQDALENRILRTVVTFRGEDLPLRAAQARLAVLEGYREREELGEVQADASAALNGERLELVRAWEELAASLSGEADPVRRNEGVKGISLHEVADAVTAASATTAPAWTALRSRWFDRLLGGGRADVPSASHVAYLRRVSPLDGTYTQERSVDVCLRTLDAIGFALADEPNIRLDLDDRPQKNPRACVIASDPPRVVHLITRAQGGLHDYTALLHEAGHALHYAGCDPELPYAFRRLHRDHALTEIYAFILTAITREPGWHAEHFGDGAAANAEAGTFLEALLFRRYAAKLRFELAFWARFGDDGGTPEGYAEELGAAIGLRYRPDGFLADMDSGFYSADYLRAWIRSAQLRAYLARNVGWDWWRRRDTGDFLRSLFREGTRPTSEEIAGRLGFAPLDTRSLLDELKLPS